MRTAENIINFILPGTEEICDGITSIPVDVAIQSINQARREAINECNERNKQGQSILELINHVQ